MRMSVGIFLMHATMQRFQKGKCLVECDPRSMQRCQTRLKIGEIIFYEHTAALKHLTKAKQVSLYNVPDYNSFCLLNIIFPWLFQHILFQKNAFLPSAQLADLSINVKILGKANRYRGITISLFPRLQMSRKIDPSLHPESRGYRKVVDQKYLFLGTRQA